MPLTIIVVYSLYRLTLNICHTLYVVIITPWSVWKICGIDLMIGLIENL